MIKIAIELSEEQIKEVFESTDIKFSKKKMQDLRKEVEELEMDYKTLLEETFMEALEELIAEKWER